MAVVRARYMKTFMAAVDRLGPTHAQAIRAAMGPDAVEAVASASAVAWIPAEYNLVATAAVYDLLTDDRAYAFFRGTFGAQLDTALFRSFKTAVARLLGRDAGRYVKFVGPAYNLAFRGVGRWEVAERRDKSALLHLKELPHAFRTEPRWLRSCCGSLHSVLDLADCEGEVTVVPDDRVVIYQFLWR